MQGLYSTTWVQLAGERQPGPQLTEVRGLEVLIAPCWAPAHGANLRSGPTSCGQSVRQIYLCISLLVALALTPPLQTPAPAPLGVPWESKPLRVPRGTAPLESGRERALVGPAGPGLNSHGSEPSRGLPGPHNWVVSASAGKCLLGISLNPELWPERPWAPVAPFQA